MTLLAVAVLGAWSFDLRGQLDSSTATPRWPDAPDDRQSPRPVPAPAAGRADAYAFLETQRGSEEPVTYDPCVPIHLVVNPRTIVDGGSRLVAEAAAAVQDATGLVLEVDGLVDERPDADRAPRAPDGTGWRPVLVAWSDPDESPGLADSVAGRGGSAIVRRDDRDWYVSGQVLLDGPQLERVWSRPGGRAEVRAVIMHELGHLVGLDHVDDPDALMQPKGRPGLTEWAPGDLAGLARLGSGPCADY